MIDLSVMPQLVQASVGANDKLPLVATAIQWGLEWFMSEGVHRWKIHRIKNKDGSCLIQMKSLCDPQPVAFSNVVDLHALTKHGYFPKELPPDVVMKPETAKGYPPFYSCKDYTVFGFEDYKPGYQVCVWAYGMADCLTGFFHRGAMSAKYYGSISLGQLWLGHGMTREQVKEYFSNPYDYDPNTSVSELPIKWSPDLN